MDGEWEIEGHRRECLWPDLRPNHLQPSTDSHFGTCHVIISRVINLWYRPILLRCWYTSTPVAIGLPWTACCPWFTLSCAASRKSISGGSRRAILLQPTALVHETYARLAVQAPPDVRDRIHFLSVAAQVMRQILIDHARTKYAQKRGGRQEKLSLDEAQEVCLETPAIMVRIDDALNELARQDARKAKLIEMRFFGGLTAEESAGVLGLPVNVVRRELRVAQAWLQRELSQDSVGASQGKNAAR